MIFQSMSETISSSISSSLGPLVAGTHPFPAFSVPVSLGPEKLLVLLRTLLKQRREQGSQIQRLTVSQAIVFFPNKRVMVSRTGTTTMRTTKRP